MLGIDTKMTGPRLAVVLALALSTAGCALPSIGMPKIPFVGGEEDPNKETWSEKRARKKIEREELKAEKDAERARAKEITRARRRGETYQEPVRQASSDGYFEEQNPYENRRSDSRNSRVASADIAPSGISPYADDRGSSRRSSSSTSAVGMAPRGTDARLSGGDNAMERRGPEPMSAEQIGQMASISTNARRSTRALGDLQPMLRDFDRIYTPRGVAPFPTVLFFHGCSGPTRSHETDWATFYTGLGYAMIAVDSIGGRDIDWEDVCNMQNLNPAERAGDVFASLEYVRDLPFVDPENLIITGFSHGAATVWATLLLASGDTPPIGIRALPRDGLHGVKAAYMFYGPCLSPWTVNIPAVSFIGENDRYIDPRDCARSARKANVSGVDFDYEIYPGATHTFDHAKPNQANREAGSVYDRKSTDQARARIKEHLARHAAK